MSEADPRLAMLIRLIGFIIFIIGIAAIYIGYTSPQLNPEHITATYLFGTLTTIAGLLLMITKYRET
jgi:hypothetical protein